MDMNIKDDYFIAAQRVLNGNGFSEQRITEIAAISKANDAKSLALYFNNNDFHWPWLDECVAVFQCRKKWPSSWEWSWFEPADESLFLSSPTEVLSKIKMADLRLIAKSLDVEIKGMKVGEARAALVRKAKVIDLQTYADELNTNIKKAYAQRQLKAKFRLLVGSISQHAYNLNRHRQISDLVDTTTGSFKVKGLVDWNCFLAKLFAPSYKFSTNNNEVLPPFYPGDTTSFKTSRAK